MTDQGLAVELYDPPGADLANDVMVRLETGEVVTLMEYKESRKIITRGGEGSGHHGHAGRPGEVGGSAPSGVATAEVDTKWAKFRKRNGQVVRIDTEREHYIKRWQETERDTILTAMEKFKEYSVEFDTDFAPAIQEVPGLDLWNYETEYDRFFIHPDGSLYMVKDHDDVGEYVIAELLDDPWHSTRMSELSWDINTNVRGKEFLIAMGFVRGSFRFEGYGASDDGSYGVENIGLVNFQIETPVTREVRRTIKDMLATYFNARVRWDSGTGTNTERIFGQGEDDLLELIKRTLEEKGGPGSGHHDHEGRPGEIGGSLPSGQTAGIKRIVRIVSVKDTREYDDASGKWKPIPGTGEEHFCDRCGKLHEIHATVELEDGSQCVVGTTCARSEFNEQVKKQMQSKVRAAKRLRVLELERAEKETTQEEWDAALVDVRQLSLPEVTFHEDVSFQGRPLKKARMGDAVAHFSIQDKFNDERMRTLTHSWHMKRMKERGFGSVRPHFDRIKWERDYARAKATLEKKDEVVERGGPGSGHHDHEGRPGEVGGSLPSGEIAIGEDDEWKIAEGEYAYEVYENRLVEIIEDHGDNKFKIEVISGPERGAFYQSVHIDDLEEPDYDLLELWTADDIDSTIARAKEVFGLTEDFSEAGYILDSGEMLDFSGKNEGGTPGTRARDHREIGQVFVGDKPPYTEGMVWFMDKANAIRMSYHTDDLMVDFAGPPTRAQRELVETIGMQSERVFWDVDRWYDADPDGGTEGRFITIESGETSNDLEEIEEMLENIRGIYYSPDYEEKSWVIRTLNQIITILRGGEGSGHHGHSGRLGEVGGSLPSGSTTSELTEEQAEAGDHVIFMWGDKSFSRLEPGNFWIVPDGRITGDIPDHGMAISFTRAFPLGFVRGVYSPRHSEILFDFRGGTLSDAAKNSIENISHFYTNLDIEIAADIQNPDWKPGDDAIRYLRNADEVMEGIGRQPVTRSVIERGGPGSGHEGHKGRPGEVGGSLPSGGSAAEPSTGRGRKPTSYSDYVEMYGARPRDGETDQEYTYRVYDNAVEMAFAELEGLTPDEILNIDKYEFNLYDLKDVGVELHINPDVELTGPAFEGLTDDQKQLLRTSYMYGVQSAYDKVLEFTHRRLVATGAVPPDDERLNYLASRPQGAGVWTEMPETLYHVTTAADAVKGDKLRSRFELGLDKTKGLGGGEDDTISFTADFEIARDIDRGLHEASAVARGDFTVEDMVRWAVEGRDAPKPYLGFLYALQSGYASISDEEMAEIDRRVAADPTDIPENVKKAMDHNIEKGANDPDMAWRFYSAYWANARQHEGGPTYPLFWGADREALANADPSQFSILEFTPTEGSLGYQMGGLGEWRTVGGDTVEVVGEHETLTADEEEEYFGR